VNDPAVRPRPAGAAFAVLPVGQTREVTFDTDAATRTRLTRRALCDQMCDQMLVAVVWDAGLKSDDLNRALFDVPIARHGFLRRTAPFNAGPTRWAPIGDRRIVALLPKCEEPDRRDHLGRIADEFRKDTGTGPSTVLVFEYDLLPDRGLAVLTRRSDVDGPALFTDAYGYYEDEITSFRELEGFVKRGGTLTFASTKAVQKGGLRLGGRTRLDRQARGLTATDLAVVWQGHNKPRDTRRPGFVLNPAYDYDGLRKWFETDLKKMLTGFVGDEKGPPSGKGQTPAPLARGGKDPIPVETTLTLRTEDRKVPITSGDIQAIEDDLAAGKVAALLATLRKLNQSDDSPLDAIAKSVKAKLSTFEFLAARYDGALEGTELGMTLFYTVLLTNFWLSLDHADSAPRDLVEDLKRAVGGGGSPIYLGEMEMMEVPPSRCWLGADLNGYRYAHGTAGVRNGAQTILFRPRIARLFSASSNPSEEGVEVQPNLAFEAIAEWWNEHFDEIARFEPEFERLDEFLKWNTVLGWLAEAGESNRLAFLAEQRVDHSAWFPDWADRHASLRFRASDRIDFLRKGDKGTTTEAIPRLKSKTLAGFGHEVPRWTISGGVSSVPPAESPRGVVPEKIPVWAHLCMRGMDLRLLDGGPDRLTTLGGTVHTFSPIGTSGPGRAAMLVAPQPATWLRERDCHLRPGLTFERLLTSGDDGVAVFARVGRAGSPRRDVDPLGSGGVRAPRLADATGLAALHIEPRANGFAVTFRAGDLGLGLAVARRLSTSQPPDRAVGLARDPDVEAAFGLDDGRFLVKVRDSGRWLRVVPEGNRPEDTYDARSADVSPGAKSLALVWVDEIVVAEELKKVVAVVVGIPDRADQRITTALVGGLPPEKNKRRGVILTGGEPGTDLRGWYDPAIASLILPVADLPAAYRAQPLLFARRFDPARMPALRELLDREAGPTP
jgi:hypothetical protein